MTPKEIIAKAGDEGFSRASVFRAREQLGTRVRNTGGRKSPENEWELVGRDDEEDIDE